MLPSGPDEKGRPQTFKSENYAEAVLQKVKRPEVQDFFGTKEVSVPVEWTEVENTVTIQLPDIDGYISSVVLTCDIRQ